MDGTRRWSAVRTVTGGHRRRGWLLAWALPLWPLVAAGCAGEQPAVAPAPEEAAAVEAVPAPAPSYDPAVLEDRSRTEDDRYRDEGFKPLEVYAFFGVEPGMTVADLWPGRGYNTHILSRLVGDGGKVLAVLGPLYNRPNYADRVRAALNERIEAGGLANVEIVDALGDVAEGSVDVAITVRNYHDLGEAEDRVAVLPELLRILKPGGILGVVDAHTPKPGRDEGFHRINGEVVIDEITGAGFELVGTSDLLYNPDDTYDFDGREEDAPIHRYFIHRFVHKYGKPAG